VASQATVSNRPSAITESGRIKASPAARKMAADRGLDLASVGAGSGPGGRIVSSDLDRVQASTPQASSIKPHAAAAPAGATRTPMSKMRRAIGLNLQQSKQTIPHFYIRREIDAAPMFAFYKASKPATGCTINDVIVLAIGRAMAEFPAVRSQVDDRDIVRFDHANIGIAVGVDDGLVVPVVTKVDTLSLADLVPQTKRVVENARKGKLENIGKGNFTVSNLGMFGVDDFAAIINPPESGILAISAVRDEPIVRDGKIEAGKRMTLTLSCDHRIVDGLTAAQFMARLKELLESPEQLG
jgi:pyruvate dehydrogenase E2 component (dihydrolipoamide acetyltransferase)